MGSGIGQDPGDLTGTIATVGSGTYNGVFYEVRWHKPSGAMWVRINSGSGVNRALTVRLKIATKDNPANKDGSHCSLTPGAFITSLDQYGKVPAGKGWSNVLLLHTPYSDNSRCHWVWVYASSDGNFINTVNSCCPCW